MHKLARGILIAIEGIDGSGKSTLSRDLHQTLQQQSFSVTLTHEPGATPLGIQLRTILHEKKVPVSNKAEYLLFAADRAQHFDDVIMPQLQQNNLIISDRMADSSLVYQGYGRGLALDILRTINDWAMQGRHPDVVIYVKIPIEVALERLKRRKKLSSFEKEKETFTNTLINGFNELLGSRDNVITLDGQEPPHMVTQKAMDAVISWIKQNNLLV